MGAFQDLMLSIIGNGLLLCTALMVICGVIYLALGALCLICSLFDGGRGNA